MEAPIYQRLRQQLDQYAVGFPVSLPMVNTAGRFSAFQTVVDLSVIARLSVPLRLFWAIACNSALINF